MSLCRKTRILLLLISLVPLVIGVGFQRYSTWKLGRYLADGTRDALAKNAETLMLTLVTDYQKMVDGDAKNLELALRIQAREAQRLMSRPPVAGHVFFANEFDRHDVKLDLVASRRHATTQADGTQKASWVSFRQAVTFLVDGVSRRDVEKDIQRLANMVDTYRALHDSEDMIWQYTALESGVHVSYPGHGGYPTGYDPRKRTWYEQARDTGDTAWVITPDATTKAITLAVSMPLYGKDGTFVGVTAIDVPLGSVFDAFVFPESWTDYAEAMLVVPDENGSELLIVAKRTDEPKRYHWAEPVSFETLGSLDEEAFGALKTDLASGKSGVRKLSFKGQESLWAYASGDASLVVVVPYDRVIHDAVVAREYVLERTIRGLQYSGLFFFAVFVFVFFLAFRLARRITAPVMQLADASSRLAEGEYHVRVDIQTGDELQYLGEVFNQTGPRLSERERMKHSLHLANEVQQNLLPAVPPEIPGFELAGASVYCEETGGDYYDFIDMVDMGRLGIAVGDVSGHGIGAALLMASARAVLRANAAYLGDQPEELFASLNRHLSRDTGLDQFMTLFFGILDATNRRLTWISGGHDPAILIRGKSGEVEHLENTGMVLGVIEDTVFSRGGPVTLEPGDIVFIGTDGIWESKNSDGAFFGKKRLEDLLRTHAHSSAEMLQQKVVEAVQAHNGSRPPDDDITLVVIKAT